MNILINDLAVQDKCSAIVRNVNGTINSRKKVINYST